LVNPSIGIEHAVLHKINYPVIIKDNAGTSSQNVWIAHDKKALEAILAFAKTVHLRGKTLTIESYILGTLYSAEVFVWKKKVKLICLTSRILSSEPYFMEEVCSLPVQFPTDQTIILKDWLSNILGAVKYTRGFAHIEFMVTQDGFEVIEINPRLGGARIGDAICDIYDLNIYEVFIEMALGKKPHLLDVTLTPKNGVAMALIYAKSMGIFKKIKGLDRLILHTGNPIYYPITYEGQIISHLNDQRACVGVLSAVGTNSEIAMQNILSAKNKLIVEMH
jgi:biotin carboxylase